jgi:hypothetical protein
MSFFHICNRRTTVFHQRQKSKVQNISLPLFFAKPFHYITTSFPVLDETFSSTLYIFSLLIQNNKVSSPEHISHRLKTLTHGKEILRTQHTKMIGTKTPVKLNGGGGPGGSCVVMKSSENVYEPVNAGGGGPGGSCTVMKTAETLEEPFNAGGGGPGGSCAIM